MKSENANAAAGSKKMKGLVAAAAMMAEGNEGSDTKSEPNSDKLAAKMPDAPMSNNTSSSTGGKTKTKDTSAARTRRLEQNRRAAIESRRRKKVMVEELERSVGFYTKANENLKMDNRDLEQRLFLAKQRVTQMEMDTEPAALKSPPEAYNKPEESKQASNLSETSLNDEQQHIAPVATIPSPPLHPSVSPMQADQVRAQLTATQALYETLGYPSDAARVAANAFSQFVGLTGTIPSTTNAASTSINLADPSLEMKPSASQSIAVQLPSEEEAGSDMYVESLQKFAMQQTAAANAAAATANAAIQALNWHKMMKANGNNTQPMQYVPPTVLMPLPPTSGPVQPALKEEEPPTKRQKS
eukprot:CAMPEP_0172302350 /NCGR_PEP_ID=MMETSP1058-20130122/4063_1 /TAXON_ID=83371 /ORGANISM="Detonula confervacea, Strain CCMP 353" /LENGTH=356 /DNA_ID=CAMNT_0013012785 /DNA_START=16 /DNA_END=1086 /DNA_ORIENTATION=+